MIGGQRLVLRSRDDAAKYVAALVDWSTDDLTSSGILDLGAFLSESHSQRKNVILSFM